MRKGRSSYSGKLDETQKAQLAATEKEHAVCCTTVKLYSAVPTEVLDRCVQYPVSRFIWLPSYLFSKVF